MAKSAGAVTIFGHTNQSTEGRMPHRMTPRPPTNQPEPDRPDDEFVAEVLKEHPEVRPYLDRAWLEGFDAHADMVDMPAEPAPEPKS